MKVRVTLKDPDGFSYSVDKAVRQFVQVHEALDEDEMDVVIERRTEKVWKSLGKFVEYQEYITVEFDTDAGTAVVVDRGTR